MYYIGIDLGGTNIAAGIVDENMKLVLKDSIPTKMPRSPEEIIADMAGLVKKLVADAGIPYGEVAWIGAGTPGTANRETGIIVFANNLKFYNVPLQDMLGKLTGKKVFIENDANAAAYGEFMAGAAKGCKSAVMITLGTGLGGGIIEKGQIINGFDYAGGELGHVVIQYGGRECTCGRKGCWEAYSSATGLINMTREAMEADPKSAMWEVAGGKLENVNGKTAFDAMRLGDNSGIEVVNMYISYLACGITNVINIFQPEMIIIGGGICKEGHYLLDPLEKIIEKEIYSRFASKKTKIRTATLGNDAGIIGAAMLGKL